jgi:hypothetical protein
VMYVVGTRQFNSFQEYRAALAAFLKCPHAAKKLARNAPMRKALLEAFLHHHHPDPASGPHPQVSEVETVVVMIHPNWGTVCFGLVLKGDGRPVSFSIRKNRFRELRRPVSSPTEGTSSAGQRRRNLNEAFRVAVESTLDRWMARNPIPTTCPVTGIRMGPMSDRHDNDRRGLPTTPTIDHQAPDFSTRVREFLAKESLAVESIDLSKDSERRVWEISDEGVRERWIEFHGQEGLRWVSLEGNQRLNRDRQVDRDGRDTSDCS